MECVFGPVGNGFAVVAADTSAVHSILVHKSNEDKIMLLDSHKLIAAIGESDIVFKILMALKSKLFSSLDMRCDGAIQWWFSRPLVILVTPLASVLVDPSMFVLCDPFDFFTVTIPLLLESHVPHNYCFQVFFKTKNSCLRISFQGDQSTETETPITLLQNNPQSTCNMYLLWFWVNNGVQFTEYIQKNMALYQFCNGIPLTAPAATNFIRGELAAAL
ncbi:Nucleophile aminohydrolase, N-terminal [Parasponia andersonii]|uniref:Nucleophile aminohydrolase, N-terminal n=1 Tax=Parasponia andersonii TaxID=3476 RepID=A0A2P5A6T6_PARAD|nr:Nucleophile aminohydrolase, N-terminal [Parasponia andersonii]